MKQLLIIFYLYSAIILNSCHSNTQTKPTIENKGNEYGLCYIPILEKSAHLLDIKDTIDEPPIKTEINGIKHYSETFNFHNYDLQLTINYSEGNTSFIIDDRTFLFKKGEYFKLNETDYSDGLEWLEFAHHIVTIGKDTYLVSRTYPNFSEGSAFNNIYFIINLSEKNENISYNLGSFGYCENIIGDYNHDGKMDIVLIDYVQTSGERMDKQDPKGIFEAQVFTLSYGNIISYNNLHGHMKCTYRYEGDLVEGIEGNWF